MSLTKWFCGWHADSSYLENSIDWVPGIKGIRLKDLPSFMRTTNPQDLMMMDFIYSQCERAQKASAIIVNTFDALEHDVLDAFTSIYCYLLSIRLVPWTYSWTMLSPTMRSWKQLGPTPYFYLKSILIKPFLNYFFII